MFPDLVLGALILGTGVAAMAGAQLFRGIVLYLVYGLLVAVAWVRLGAVDVALAEAAIGAGLTAVLLLTAAHRLPDHDPTRRTRPLAALAAAGLSGALIWAWFATPADPGLTGAVSEALPATGLGNPVTGVLLDFRAWDTLLESTVLLAALLGVWILGRSQDWSGPLGPPQRAHERGALALLGQVLPPLGLLIGVYLVLTGTDKPGGAFQGGTVLAAMGIVAAMAGQMRPPRMEALAWRAALVLGPVGFLLAGAATLAWGAGFLTWPEAQARWIIIGIELVLTLSIAVTLALLVLGTARARPYAPTRAPNDAPTDAPAGAPTVETRSHDR